MKTPDELMSARYLRLVDTGDALFSFSFSSVTSPTVGAQKEEALAAKKAPQKGAKSASVVVELGALALYRRRRCRELVEAKQLPVLEVLLLILLLLFLALQRRLREEEPNRSRVLSDITTQDQWRGELGRQSAGRPLALALQDAPTHKCLSNSSRILQSRPISVASLFPVQKKTRSPCNTSVDRCTDLYWKSHETTLESEPLSGRSITAQGGTHKTRRWTSDPNGASNSKMFSSISPLLLSLSSHNCCRLFPTDSREPKRKDGLQRRAHELQPATPSVGGYNASSLGFSLPFNTFFRSLSTLFFPLFWFFSSARASSGGGKRPSLCRRRRRRRDADERSTSSFARQDCGAQQLRPRLREDAWACPGRPLWSAASRGYPSPRLGHCCNSPRRPARSAAARAFVMLRCSSRHGISQPVTPLAGRATAFPHGDCFVGFGWWWWCW